MILFHYLPQLKATLLFDGEGWSEKREKAYEFERHEAEEALRQLRGRYPGQLFGAWERTKGE